MKKKNRMFLLATSFLSGAVVMVLEILGFRMLAPYFGYSVYVWGSLIGIVMVALSAGYYIGGKIADKKQDLVIIYSAIMASAVYNIGVLFFYRQLFESLYGLGSIYGSLVGTTIVYGPPMLLLSMVSPFFIKAISKADDVGTSAGKIYSISTAGSIFGVFFSTFFLIPNYGTKATLIFCIAVLMVVSVIGLLRSSRKNALFLLLFLAVFLVPEKKGEGVVFDEDSFYNRVVVEKDEHNIYLTLNQNKYYQSLMGERFYSSYLAYFLAGPLMVETDDLLVLGMGAGASVVEISNHFPDIRIDAVEIDPTVAYVADEYFGTGNVKNLNVYIDDAKTYAKNSDGKYDIIEVDLFQGGPYIPFYTATKEFFQDCYGALDDDGMIMMNIIDYSDDKKVAGPIENTILSVFPSVFEIRYSSNYIVFAFKEEMTKEMLAERLGSQDQFDMTGFLEEIREVRYDKDIIVLTDDKAPLAKLTYNMLKEHDEG